MHPFSILTLLIFVAGYITARWDLVTRLYELAIFAWDHGVVVRVHYQTFYLSRYFPTAPLTSYAFIDQNRKGISLPLCFLLRPHHSDQPSCAKGVRSGMLCRHLFGAPRAVQKLIHCRYLIAPSTRPPRCLRSGTTTPSRLVLVFEWRMTTCR